jgi:hypothetical protein
MCIFQQTTQKPIYGSKIQDDSYMLEWAGQTNHADDVGDMCFQCMVPCSRHEVQGAFYHKMIGGQSIESYN